VRVLSLFKRMSFTVSEQGLQRRRNLIIKKPGSEGSEPGVAMLLRQYNVVDFYIARHGCGLAVRFDVEANIGNFGNVDIVRVPTPRFSTAIDANYTNPRVQFGYGVLEGDPTVVIAISRVHIRSTRFTTRPSPRAPG